MVEGDRPSFLLFFCFVLLTNNRAKKSKKNGFSFDFFVLENFDFLF